MHRRAWPYWLQLKFHWDQFPLNFPIANVTGKSPTSYEEVTRKLATFRPSRHVKMVWRRRQQVREEVTGKLVPVEFELYTAATERACRSCAMHGLSQWNSLANVRRARTNDECHGFGSTAISARCGGSSCGCSNTTNTLRTTYDVEKTCRHIY